MAEFVLKIDGVERDAALESLEVRRVVNGPAILTVDINDEDGTYQPPLDGIVQLTRTDVSPNEVYFEGPIQTTREGALTGWGDARVTEITAHSYEIYATLATVENFTIDAHTLDTVLAAIVSDYLTDYGVTLHPSQAQGAVIDPLGFDGVTAESILNELSQRTGWVWSIDADKRLRMWDPTTESASFNVTATNGKYVGDITVERFRQKYANRVIVYGGEGFATFTNDRMYGDGSSREFLIAGPLDFWNGEIYVTISGVTTMYQHGTGTPYNIEEGPYNLNTSEHYRILQDNTETPLGPTDYIEISYRAFYPMRIAADGRTGSPLEAPRDLIVYRPDLFNRDAMQQLADSLLAASMADFVRPTYPSDDIDIAPGQVQTITLSERNLSGSFVAMETVLAHVPDGDPSQFRVTVTAINEAGAVAQLMDLYRKWLGGERRTATSTGVSASGGAGGVGPAAPNLSLQFNRQGQFGGSAAVTVTEDATSVHIGDDNNITGARYSLAIGEGHLVA